ncbi:MAG: lipase family protein [Myxococcales bacterium]|nr:lipase family protein [Myxococcales bacterium]
MFGERSLILMSLVTALGGAGCSTSAGEDFDPAFYVPPDPLPSETPGTLIRAESMEPFADGMNVWRVLYVSQAVDGTPIAVSGMVASPTGAAPEAGYDVVTWGHGTKGIADPCAPSRFYRSGFQDFVDIAPELVAAGYVGVASDYEGLGTPGIHPYLLGASEGRGQLDIVKAAQQIDEARAGSRVVIWGRSQGGHAALFSGEIAPDWAPELTIRGVISAAPAAELPGSLSFGAVVPGAFGFFWQLTVGFDATYDELSIEDIYTDEALATIRGLIDEEACGGTFSEVAREVEGAGFKTNPTELPEWLARLEESSPGRVRTDVPILLLQGTDDEVVPKVLTDILNINLCAIGSRVDYRVFEGFGHNDSTLMNMPLMLEWTAARFAGEPATTTCE